MKSIKAQSGIEPRTSDVPGIAIKDSLSPRERARVRGRNARFLSAAWFLARSHRPAIFRHWLRRSVLQLAPNGIADHLLFAPQTPIPESQNFDAALGKPGISLRVQTPLMGCSVSAAIQFNVEHRFKTKEIENVRRVRMLTSKLVSGKPAVTKPGPQEFFGPGVVLAKRTGNPSEFWRGHACTIENSSITSIFRRQREVESLSTVPPHPSPLPRGEGIPLASSRATHGQSAQSSAGPIAGRSGTGSIPSGIEPATSLPSTNRIQRSPLPKGEGKGEGKARWVTQRPIVSCRTSNPFHKPKNP